MTSIYGNGYVADIDTSQERVDLTQENEQMPLPYVLTMYVHDNRADVIVL